jgi:hypothetical protein
MVCCLILIADYIRVINLKSSTDRSVSVTSGGLLSGRKTAEATINHATTLSPGRTHGHDTMLDEIPCPHHGPWTISQTAAQVSRLVQAIEFKASHRLLAISPSHRIQSSHKFVQIKQKK